MGFKFCCGVDVMGAKGGLWVAWNACFDVSVVRRCDRFIVFNVLDDRGD